MPVRTRDWLKFGTLVAIAFVFGLAFASTLNLPKKSGAAETLVVPPLSSQPAPAAPEFSAPALKSAGDFQDAFRSEEHTSELQSHLNLVCRLLLEKKKKREDT